jgi:hypothetical protein
MPFSSRKVCVIIRSALPTLIRSSVTLAPLFFSEKPACWAQRDKQTAPRRGFHDAIRESIF